MTLETLPLAVHLTIALVAGVLLNLTPCVLPAIPIKIRTILRESGTQTSHRALAAGAFFAGVMVLFLTVAALTAFLHWNWGALFQLPAMIVLLVVVLVGFAVITWLDVPIPVPAFAANTRGHHYVEAFVSGLLSSILAAPCAGPFLGGVLVFAVTQSVPVIFLLFAAVGLGLSLPYIVLLLKPEWLRRMPRSGPWAVTVREALAFVLLGAAVFFAAELLPGGWHAYLWWAWFAAVVGWALWQVVRRDWYGRVIALIVAAGALVLVDAMAMPGQARAGDHVPWMAYTPALQQQAEREGHAYLVEFTADWCINCKVLEKTVYSDPTVVRLVRSRQVVPLQVDLTQSNPVGEALLAKLGGHAIPYAVVVAPDGQTIKSFSGLFTTGALKEALSNTRVQLAQRRKVKE